MSGPGVSEPRLSGSGLFEPGPSESRLSEPSRAESGRSAPDVSGWDMSFLGARVTHLPPLCDRAYRRNCNVSATEVRQLRDDSSTARRATDGGARAVPQAVFAPLAHALRT